MTVFRDITFLAAGPAGERSRYAARVMTVEQFIAAQQILIAEGDFEAYLPTLWIETTNEVYVNVLTDAPDEDDLEQVARDWALRIACNHDYFLAFKADRLRLNVVARVQGVQKERIVLVAAV